MEDNLKTREAFHCMEKLFFLVENQMEQAFLMKIFSENLEYLQRYSSFSVLPEWSKNSIQTYFLRHPRIEAWCLPVG